MRIQPIPFIFLSLNFFYTFHYTLISFINSSYLESFLPLPQVGLVFSVAALISIFLLSYLEHLLVRFGERATILYLAAIDVIAIAILSWHGGTPFFFKFFVIGAFAIHFGIGVFILRTLLDIYFEEKSANDSTGVFRGELLTSANLAWVLSPLVVSQVLNAADYWRLYTLSLCASGIFFWILYTHLPHRGISMKRVYFIETLRETFRRKKVFLVTLANFLMHFFFSWMIIYLPILLEETIGFNWEDAGLILAIMLLPYVLLDIPLGKLVDRYGERTFLVGGFFVVAIFTAPISFIATSSFVVWATLLFITRIGTATVELATDTYFFRNVEARDGNLISFYRLGQPLAYVVAPVIASILLVTGSTTQNLFLVLSLIMLLGVLVSFFLKKNLR